MITVQPRGPNPVFVVFASVLDVDVALLMVLLIVLPSYEGRIAFVEIKHRSLSADGHKLDFHGSYVAACDQLRFNLALNILCG